MYLRHTQVLHEYHKKEKSFIFNELSFVYYWIPYTLVQLIFARPLHILIVKINAINLHCIYPWLLCWNVMRFQCKTFSLDFRSNFRLVLRMTFIVKFNVFLNVNFVFFPDYTLSFMYGMRNPLLVYKKLHSWDTTKYTWARSLKIMRLRHFTLRGSSMR